MIGSRLARRLELDPLVVARHDHVDPLAVGDPPGAGVEVEVVTAVVVAHVRVLLCSVDRAATLRAIEDTFCPQPCLNPRHLASGLPTARLPRAAAEPRRRGRTLGGDRPRSDRADDPPLRRRPARHRHPRRRPARRRRWLPAARRDTAAAADALRRRGDRGRGRPRGRRAARDRRGPGADEDHARPAGAARPADRAPERRGQLPGRARIGAAHLERDAAGDRRGGPAEALPRDRLRAERRNAEHARDRAARPRRPPRALVHPGARPGERRAEDVPGRPHRPRRDRGAGPAARARLRPGRPRRPDARAAAVRVADRGPVRRSARGRLEARLAGGRRADGGRRRHRLEMGADSLEWAAGFLAGLGADFRVVRPDELRACWGSCPPGSRAPRSRDCPREPQRRPA